MSVKRTYSVLLDTEDGRWYVNEYQTTSSGTHCRTVVEGLDKRTAERIARAGERFESVLEHAVEQAKAKGYQPR